MDGSKGLSVTSSINKARTSALSGVPTGGAHANGAVAAGSGNGSQDLAVARAGAVAIPGADVCFDFIAMGAEDTSMIPGSRSRGTP